MTTTTTTTMMMMSTAQTLAMLETGEGKNVLQVLQHQGGGRT